MVFFFIDFFFYKVSSIYSDNLFLVSLLIIIYVMVISLVVMND